MLIPSQSCAEHDIPDHIKSKFVYNVYDSRKSYSFTSDSHLKAISNIPNFGNAFQESEQHAVQP